MILNFLALFMLKLKKYTAQRRLWILGFILLIIFAACSNRKNLRSKLHQKIKASDLQVHIKNLEPENHNVRETGSPQEAIAAHYIANVFDLFHLSPMGDDSTYYQGFTVTSGVKLGDRANQITFAGKKFSTRFSDIIPLPNSASTKVEGILAWAGYGFTDSTRSYNDYHNIDVNGKVVLFIRDGPFHKKSVLNHEAYANLLKKIRLAQKNGAVAAIVAPGYRSKTSSKLFPLELFNEAYQNIDIPVMQVTNSIASQILDQAGLNYRRLETKINQNEKPDSRITQSRIQVDVDLTKEKNLARNIVSHVEGTQFSKRYIVIMAPYDYGRERIKSTAAVDDRDLISTSSHQMSVSGLMELAQYYSAHKSNNSLLFVALAGNDFGKSGLYHFLKNPPVDPENILAMIDLQKINRVQQDSLLIYGTNSSRGWNQVLSRSNSGNLPIRTISGYRAEEDTLSGIGMVPMIRLISQGTSKNARVKKQNKIQGAVETLHYVTRVINQIDQDDKDTLGFSANMYTQSQKFQMPDVVLGVMPDYYFRGEGLRIQYVSKGGPADKAGIQVGDIITAIGDQNVTNMNNYIDILNHLHKGEQTTVTVKRNGKKMKLNIRF